MLLSPHRYLWDGFMRLFLPLLALAFAAVTPASYAQDVSARERARIERILRRTPLIDGHNDLAWSVRANFDSDLERVDLNSDTRELSTPMQTDFPRLRAGGVGAQFWSVYVPARYSAPESTALVFEQIDLMQRIIARYPRQLEFADSAADIVRIHRAGRIASMFGMEGGEAIANNLALLRSFRRAGVLYMTLTHATTIDWVDSATDAPRHEGLTPFGEEVVREMNRIGMLVDLSHVSADAMRDAIRVSAAPVIFSHSNARAVADVPRNVPDAILRQLPKNGGVVMATFVPGFTSTEVATYDRRASAQLTLFRTQHPKDESAVTKLMDDWRKANPAPRATVAQVVDHIDHIRRVAGIDHIGLGGDFDGITDVVQGLEDVSTYPAVTAEMLRRGYSDDDVKKVLGLNVLRAWKQAERVSADLRRQRGPSSATLERMDGTKK